MGILPNIRHERMAQDMARGVKIRTAAIRAGYEESSISYAYTIVNMPEFKARVTEILEEAAEAAIIDIQGIMRIASEVAQADIREGFQSDEAGKIELLPIEQWSNRFAMSVEGIEFDKEGRPKIKVSSRLKAIELLMRANGMFKDTLALTGPNGGPLETVSAEMHPEKAAELYQMMLGK